MEEWGQIGPGSLNLASPTEVGETIKGTSSLHGVVSRTEQGGSCKLRWPLHLFPVNRNHIPHKWENKLHLNLRYLTYWLSLGHALLLFFWVQSWLWTYGCTLAGAGREGQAGGKRQGKSAVQTRGVIVEFYVLTWYCKRDQPNTEILQGNS